MKKEEIKKVVRKSYAKIAKQDTSCCAPVDSCCGSVDLTQDISKKIGYSEEDIKAVPEGANMGLGCGNPVALSSLREGETVLDLGSGGGFDCFLAAEKVGKTGRVIGVDMTPEMIDKARENAQKGKYENVEFRLGEIENLPAADNSVDIIISNCVINLAPDKKNVFKEAFRVLKPGGRLMVSDIVLEKELPDKIRSSIEAYVACVSGALLKDEYIEAINEAGFRQVKIVDETRFPYDLLDNDPTTRAIIKNLRVSPEEVKEAAGSVLSINIYGVKP
jgi:SAM-dependent methyltransferase